MLKKLNLKEEIENERIGVHYINLREKDKFLSVIRKLEKEKIFQNSNMTMSYMIEDECISVAIHKSTDSEL